jgi:hypothetical protein
MKFILSLFILTLFSLPQAFSEPDSVRCEQTLNRTFRAIRAGIENHVLAHRPDLNTQSLLDQCEIAARHGLRSGHGNCVGEPLQYFSNLVSNQRSHIDAACASEACAGLCPFLVYMRQNGINAFIERMHHRGASYQQNAHFNEQSEYPGQAEGTAVAL